MGKEQNESQTLIQRMADNQVDIRILTKKIVSLWFLWLSDLEKKEYKGSITSDCTTEFYEQK